MVPLNYSDSEFYVTLKFWNFLNFISKDILYLLVRLIVSLVGRKAVNGLSIRKAFAMRRWIYIPLLAVMVVGGYLRGALYAASTERVYVVVHWHNIRAISKATPTLQVVVNPLLRPDSPVSHRALRAVKHLGANYVRFVPWLPYPRLAVAELKPPSHGHTYWNFSLIDPMVRAFMRATAGHSVIMNFSTIPEWLFKTPKPVPYPKNPNQVYWNYERGTQLRGHSLKPLADYYARLVSWYTRGGFRDQLGHWHHSGYHYHFAWWEVLNEVNFEHHMNVQEYTRWYDAITAAIHKVSPTTRFVGLALAEGENPGNIGWFKYFLNPRHHAPGTPLNMISFHFYASTGNRNPADWSKNVFPQADGFIRVTKKIVALRNRLSPDTMIDTDEIGVFLPGDNTRSKPLPIPRIYWNLSGVMFAYVYAHLAAIGVNVVGESQLIGYPTQYPSVSMVNWHTGVPNARFRVLELLVRNFGPGDKLCKAVVRRPNRLMPGIFARGFITSGGKRKILLVNKADASVEVSLPGRPTVVYVVDGKTGSGQPAAMHPKNGLIRLGAWTVAVADMPH